MKHRPLNTLTARLALLFSIATLITFTLVGGFLSHSLSIQLELRDDHELIGKVDQFRDILQETPTIDAIADNQHRFVDAAAGHEGLIVVLRDQQGKTVMRNERDAVGVPDFAIVPADQRPDLDSLGVWEYAPGRVARTVTAWGRVGTSDQLVQIVIARTTSDRMALLSAYRRDVLGAMLFGALFAAVLGYAVVRRALLPIKAIAQHAHSITAQHLDTRLDASSVPNELQTLVQSFNDVLDRLQGSFQRLSQFSADLAHDLRTPLYNLTIQTQVALSQRRSEDEYLAMLSSGLEEYERLTRMVEGMLFLARADNAQVELNRQDMQAEEELQKIADYFEGIAADAGVQVVVEGNAKLNADPALFRRAVSNLVANAIRYTAQGESVRLRAANIPNSTSISVINPGVGIDQHHLPRLFDRFYRADSARSHSSFSTGLGLSIVRTIMKLHGGSVEVQSVPHAETCFSLHFPAYPTTKYKSS
ncbi:heavy metal sensor histidine kinase [Herbaspirillum sp. GCM10030257]|uniref:heavy metal sensor histidine kinase n=1 Tax=Herbaspirillum sp. GCM10030257 TaxID=3273393 RepID=UPI00360F8A3A